MQIIPLIHAKIYLKISIFIKNCFGFDAYSMCKNIFVSQICQIFLSSKFYKLVLLFYTELNFKYKYY